MRPSITGDNMSVSSSYPLSIGRDACVVIESHKRERGKSELTAHCWSRKCGSWGLPKQKRTSAAAAADDDDEEEEGVYMHPMLSNPASVESGGLVWPHL